MVDVTTHELDPEEVPLPPKGARSAEGDVTPSIAWLVVEPRHYQEAQRLKKDEGIEAYRGYVLSLVFSLDGQRMPPQQSLTKKVIGQIVTAFEERFSEKDEGKK